MTKVKTIDIKGKPYVTVAERVRVAHEELKQISISTEILPIENMVVIKATVITPKGSFTGMSAANPNKIIEKMSPYEVAETSAVGRALGFAGYGIVEGLATADEIKKVEASQTKVSGKDVEYVDFGSGKPKYKCVFCHTNDNRHHKPNCPNETKINPVGKRSVGTIETEVL